MKTLLLVAATIAAFATRAEERHHRHPSQTYTQTQTQTRTWGASFTDALTVPRFSLSGMCLDSVVVTQTLSARSSFTGTNRDAFPGLLTINLDVLLTFTPLSLHLPAAVNQTVPPGPVSINPLVAGTTITSYAANPATYSGVGTVSFLVSGAVISSSSRSGNFSQTSWPVAQTATVSVTYTYHRCGCTEFDDED